MLRHLTFSSALKSISKTQVLSSLVPSSFVGSNVFYRRWYSQSKLVSEALFDIELPEERKLNRKPSSSSFVKDRISNSNDRDDRNDRFNRFDRNDRNDRNDRFNRFDRNPRSDLDRYDRPSNRRDNFSSSFSSMKRSRPSPFASQHLIGQYNSFKTEFPYTEAPELQWDQIETLSPQIKTTLTKDFKYTTCTPVQSAILSKMPIETDILVQAKTGTGKTLGFLVPALEMVTSKLHPYGRETKVLIISPTRELALQIAQEANRLCKASRLGVQCLVGGDSKYKQLQSFSRDRVDFVVGTPGRLIDCLESDNTIRNALSKVDILVLDEADRMLEIGFKEDIERIVEHLPKERRTFLFSATYPKNVHELVESTLQPGFQVINTISPEDVNTVQTIQQEYHITNMHEQLVQLHNILKRGLTSGEPFKCIVFWNTSKMTEVMTQLFTNSGITRLFELHSKKTQVYRARVSQTFRACKTGILFTSDVSARGVDYPGVHLVVQMGIPSTKDQYVHRVGRTGRAGKSGQSLIFLAPFEAPFVQELQELPLTKSVVMEEGEAIQLDLLSKAKPMDRVESHSELLRATKSVDPYDVHDAMMSYIGFYQSQFDFFKKNKHFNAGSIFIKDWTQLAKSLGLETPPSVPSNALRCFESLSAPSNNQRRSGSRSRTFNSSSFRN